MHRQRISYRSLLPPALVAFAAMLWGTDGIWRTSLIQTMPATTIVFWEHVILVAVTGWLLWRERGQLARLDAGDWVAALVIGIGASGLATVLFTAAFTLASPTTVLLLQKTQPLIAISLAAVMLLGPLLATALLAGLAGLMLYYRGLRDTPAAVATLCELCFPITAVLLNVFLLGVPLNL